MGGVKVRICEAGGVFDEVMVPENSTVADVLRKGNVRTDIQKEIRVNDEDATLDTIIKGGDLIYIVPQVRGN